MIIVGAKGLGREVLINFMYEDRAFLAARPFFERLAISFEEAGLSELVIREINRMVQKNPDEIVLYDDQSQDSPDLVYDSYPLIKSFSQAVDYIMNIDNRFITAIGHPRVRKKLTDRFENAGGILVSSISPYSHIAPKSIAQPGIITQPGSGISNDSIIGKSVVLLSNSLIGHDCEIGDFVTIGPNCTILAKSVGDYTFIGAGSVVVNNVSIGRFVYVGAGCIVDRNLADNETYLGTRG